MVLLPYLQTYNASAKKRVPDELSAAFAHAKNRGAGKVESGLQDLYFRIVNPDQYHQTKQRIDALLKKQGMSVGEIIAAMGGILMEEDICVLDIHGRIKGTYSTYLKLFKYDMDMSLVHDLIAVRIIVDDINTCYQVLRAIHRRYVPLSGRIKDYIVTPKLNGYQSLHSTVNGGKTGMFEVQIRTGEMHAQAEIGSAAHWAYDLAKSSQRIMNSPPECGVKIAMQGKR